MFVEIAFLLGDVYWKLLSQLSYEGPRLDNPPRCVVWPGAPLCFTLWVWWIVLPRGSLSPLASIPMHGGRYINTNCDQMQCSV